MDRELDSAGAASTACDLLSVSPEFEPYIPSSPQNAFHSLKLLGHLGEVTERSLADPAAAATTPVEKPELTQLIIAAPIPAHAPATKAKPTPKLGAASGKKGRAGDQELLDALQELRKSGRFVRRPTGECTSIVKK